MKRFFTPLETLSRAEKTVLVVVECVIGLGLWQLLGNSLIPGPIRVLTSVANLATTPVFWENFIASLYLTTVGMGLSIIISLALVYMSVIPALTPVTQLVTKLRYLTLSGLVFVFTLLTKDGSQLKTSLLIFGIVPFFVTSLMSTIASINVQEYELAKTLKMNPLKTMWEVIVVGRLDSAIDTVRQNFAIAWMMITMVEGLSMSEGGLGSLIIKSNKYLDLSTVFSLLVVVFVLGLLIDYTLRKLRELLFPYVKIGVK